MHNHNKEKLAHCGTDAEAPKKSAPTFSMCPPVGWAQLGTDRHSIMRVLILYSIHFKPIVMGLYRPDNFLSLLAFSTVVLRTL